MLIAPTYRELAPLGGGRTGMGAGGSPSQTGRISGVCAARPDWLGLPTAPKGGAEGGRRQKGICAPDSRGRRGLMCDMRDYRLR